MLLTVYKGRGRDDGEEYQTQVGRYDPVALNEQINNSEIFTVVIGDVIIARINVKAIIPVSVEN